MNRRIHCGCAPSRSTSSRRRRWRGIHFSRLARYRSCFERLPLTEDVTFDEAALLINSSDFEDEINIEKVDGTVYAQLQRYVTAGAVIRSHV